MRPPRRTRVPGHALFNVVLDLVLAAVFLALAWFAYPFFAVPALFFLAAVAGDLRRGK